MSDVPYRTPGRPPRAPRNKIGQPIRCLVTIGVRAALEELASEEGDGINLSDMLRLSLYRYLESRGKMTPALANDATWDELKKTGII